VLFAEDIFGVQFALCIEGVKKFDGETGDMEPMAEGLDEWAKLVLGDCDYLTGYPIAREWQSKNGPLPAGKRLAPKIPFVLGGGYDIENLYVADELELMEFRADLWRQTRGLPDGSKIKLNFVK
jgi:hypothetical protein